jgi:DNA-binding protein H-NS
MNNLTDLLAQRAALEKRIADAQREERSTAIAKVKAMMTEYGLTLADLGTKGAGAARAAGGKKIAAKYRNAATGETWSGRGLKPNWLKAAMATGRKIDDFAV